MKNTNQGLAVGARVSEDVLGRGRVAEGHAEAGAGALRSVPEHLCYKTLVIIYIYIERERERERERDRE